MTEQPTAQIQSKGQTIETPIETPRELTDEELTKAAGGGVAGESKDDHHPG
jgi:hypothetical protein